MLRVSLDTRERQAIRNTLCYVTTTFNKFIFNRYYMKHFLILALVFCSLTANAQKVKISTWQIPIGGTLLGDAENEYKIPKEPGFYTSTRWSRCEKDTCDYHAGYHVMGVRCPNNLPVKQWVSEIIWKEMKKEWIGDEDVYMDIEKLPINTADISNKDIADYYLDSWKKQYDHYIIKPHEYGFLEQYGLFVMDVWKYNQYNTMWVYSWYDHRSSGDNTQNSFYTVSLISGKVMTLKDIIDEKDFPKLEKLLKQKILRLVRQNGFEFYGDEKPLLDQISGIALVKEGLIVYFHPYTIGCGAEGQYNVIFPYSQLKRDHIQIKI